MSSSESDHPDDAGSGPMEGTAAELVALLEAAAEKAEALADGSVEGRDLGAVLVAEHRCRQRADAAMARMGRRFQMSGEYRADGDRTAVCWLSRHSREAKPQWRAQLRLGKDLALLPAVEAAVRAGEINRGHAEVLAGLAHQSRYTDAYHEAEEVLLGWARTMYWDEFHRNIARWKAAADPDGTERDVADDYQARHVNLTPGLRGTGLLDGELTATCRETVTNALERIEAELFHADREEARERLGRDPEMHELSRTREQRMHDALEEMAVRATMAPKDGKRPEPLLSVFVGLKSLERACELESGQCVTPGQVAGLLDRAMIERIVWDSPSRISQIGEKRTFTGALRRAIQARDRVCQVDGCGLPAKWCEVDHQQPWSQNGKTVQANGMLLCGYHNRYKADVALQHLPPIFPRRPPGEAGKSGQRPAA